MSPQPSSLRRRYQGAPAHQQQRRTDNHSSDRSWRTTEHNELDLSVYMPSDSSRNRFIVLRSQSPGHLYCYGNSAHPHSNRIFRARASRESRRRRDARRARRRLNAAQMLDEQLSRDIDRTLDQANIPRPLSRSLPSPSPVRPTLSAFTPPAPPQLPLLNFGGLDLMDDFPPLTPTIASPTPQAPSPVHSPTPLSIPSWCPPLPSFTKNHIKLSEFPLFFDLSKLPEPRLPPPVETRCQELQLWSPLIRNPRPRKHSRFFPPRESPKLSVKLPPTSCRLHVSDHGSQDVDEARFPAVPSTRPRGVDQASFPLLTLEQQDVAPSIQDELTEASAADLWRILASTERSKKSTREDPYIYSFTDLSNDNDPVPSYGHFDHRLATVGAPFELENREIPFVHANSLTGHANERASDLTLTFDNDVEDRADSAIAHSPVHEFMYGLNEYMVDHDILGPQDEVLPELPPSPSPEDTDSVINAAHANGVAETVEEASPSRSDEQYNSEQALFDLESGCIEADMVDVATFLTMGHAENCWCNDCDDEIPELVELHSEDENGDDNWAAYSPDTASDWEWDWETPVSDEERDICAGRWEWNEDCPLCLG